MTEETQTENEIQKRKIRNLCKIFNVIFVIFGLSSFIFKNGELKISKILLYVNIIRTFLLNLPVPYCVMNDEVFHSMFNETGRSEENTSNFLMRIYRYCYLLESIMVLFVTVSCGITKSRDIKIILKKVKYIKFKLKYQHKIYVDLKHNLFVACSAILCIIISFTNYWKNFDATDLPAVYGYLVDLATISYLLYIVFLKISASLLINLMAQYRENLENGDKTIIDLSMIVDLKDEFDHIFGRLTTAIISMLTFYHTVRVRKVDSS